ncbi:MAG: hypothetical protein HQ548_04285, partial [Chloroflexi bacterium]|nr:hypothetical protein [Chloroflexota bacterium]
DKLGFRSPSDELRIPVGEWTRWVDVTQDISDGPWARGGGPWATGRFTFGGVTRGVAEVQLAWFSHEGAVLKTTRPGIAAATAVFMVPLEAQATPPDSGTNLLAGAWGKRLDEIVGRFETAADTHVRHFEWGRQAVADLGLRADAPTPRLLRLDTGCSAAPAALETAQRMLTALGLNDVGVKDPALLKELGQEAHHFIGANDSQYLCLTHDPLDPVAERNFEKSLRAQANRLAGPRGDPLPRVTLKMGDEIGAVAGAASINGLETCRKAFIAYLADFLKANQLDPSFFGVQTLEELSYTGTRPPRAGLFERRLSYHCEKFKFVLTAMYYAQITRAAERVFPSVQTYCNFSPHPPMFGQHMNGSDWFTLTREGGANTAWGEGWASGGGWGFVGHEVVSYYAAWVECAGRAKANPAGFYVVGTMGGADKKMLSLVAHGIFNIQLYSWGPIYAGAEGSNFWSERRETYAEIARGAYALGPADEIIARGRRQPRRVALLYNRTHEIWNGADGGFQSDRLLTFMALTHAHTPVDIILVEDLTPEHLAAYKALYIQGYNLNRAALPVLRNWVADGGILVASAGTATRDEYDSPLPEAETLFGAGQRFSAQSSGNWHPQHLPAHAAIDRLTLQDSALTPSLSVDVIGVKYDILPTTATPVGTFQDGSCGAALNAIGKGQVLLLGVTPGHIYKGKTEGSSRYTLENGPIITKAAATAIPERVAD